MIPTLLELGPIPVRSFGLMVALALIVGSIRLTRSFARYGINVALAERYVMVAGLTGLLGARIWYIAENWSHLRADLIGALLNSAGFTFYGGFIIAAISVLIVAYRDGTPFGRLCDAMGPCLSIGYAIGRLGCQLSGDGDYGIPTSSWWGMSYSTGVVPTLPGELVYPTPLFESAISLTVLWVLSKVESSESLLSHSFQRFGLYLVLISLERFLMEFLRGNPTFVGILSEAQVIALALMFVGTIFVVFPRGTVGSSSTA